MIIYSFLILLFFWINFEQELTWQTVQVNVAIGTRLLLLFVFTGVQSDTCCHSTAEIIYVIKNTQSITDYLFNLLIKLLILAFTMKFCSILASVFICDSFRNGYDFS